MIQGVDRTSSAPGAEAAERRLWSLVSIDVALVLMVVVLTGALFGWLDVSERLLGALAPYERMELDDLLLALSLGFVLAAGLAALRSHQSHVHLRALQASVRVQRLHVARLEELSSALLSAEERERGRLADLLHDEVAQALYACRLRLSVLKELYPNGQARALAEEIDGLALEALSCTRELSTQLVPPLLQELGLFEALSAVAASFERRHAVQMRLEPSGAFEAIGEPARAPVFHSLKELMLNAGKHARADEICVRATRVDSRVVIEVQDDGQGFALRARAERSGFGLFSIERRMACLGGELFIDSSADHGTIARLSIPSAC